MSVLHTVPVNDLSRFEVAPVVSVLFDVVTSGRFVHGHHHEMFEDEFARYLGANHCAGVASGSDALELVLRAHDVGPHDRVLTVANAGGYATNAILKVGATPVFADIDGSLTLDPEFITETIDVVVVTHLFGRMANMPQIAERCDRFGSLLVEDCAQAAGAMIHGVKAGAWGQAAAFSFYPTKNLGALGDGGAVVCRAQAADEKVRTLREHGWDTHERGLVSQKDGGNSRLDEIQAAVLRHRLPLLDEHNRRRIEILSMYQQSLPSHVGHFAFRGLGLEHVAHLAVVACQERDSLRAHLEHQGIGTAVHYPVLDHHQPAWQLSADVPVTEHMAGRVLTIPCFPTMTDDEVDRVCGALATA